eukprot:Hpha_TRINITY_DN13560_c0_g2::TRINITY_DN13560_c0_g2_i1::g.111498::m.111498
MKAVIRSVAGRRFEVDADTGDTLKDLLRKACSIGSYNYHGSKFVLRGNVLGLDAKVEEVIADGEILFLVAAKAQYGSTNDDGSPKACAVTSPHKTPARELAAQRDFSGPEFDGPLPLLHRQGMAQLDSALQRRGADGDFEELLRMHPTMTHVRQVVQADNSLLEPILRQIQKIAVPLVNAIATHRIAFRRILNTPVNAEPAPDEPLDEAEARQLWDQDDMSERSDEAAEAGVAMQDVELTAEEEEAVLRVVSLGQQNGLGPFPRELVLQVFLDAGRNEHLAAQYLIDYSMFDPLAFALAQRQAALQAQHTQQSQQQGEGAADAAAQGAEGQRDAIAAARKSVSSGEEVDTGSLLRVLESSIARLGGAEEAKAAAREIHADAAHVLLTHAVDKNDMQLQFLLHEHLALATCAERFASAAGQLLPPDARAGPALSFDRLHAVAKREGCDCLLLHCADARLCLWQLRHDAPVGSPDALVLRRSDTLGPREQSMLRSAPKELAASLSASAGSASVRMWTLLHRLHALIFGECNDWMPRRVNIVSTLALPFHALTPQGGVPLGRGRVVMQSPSLVWLEHAQRLAQRPVSAGRSAPLRSSAPDEVRNGAVRRPLAARLQPQTLVPVDSLEAREPLAVWQVSAASAAPARPPGIVDLVVGVGSTVRETEGDWDAAVELWDSGLAGPWCCSACIPVLPHVGETPEQQPRTQPPLPPLPTPPPAGGGVGNVLCRLMAEGRRKADAYAAAVAAASEGPPQGWVAWTLVGTSLALGGRRAHVDPSGLRQTQGYRFLDQHAMHKVFDEMARFLLSERPEDPVDALLRFMEANQDGLNRLSQTGSGSPPKP